MKNHRTELIFILDKSGSMAGLERDTIGGYNAMLKKQQEGPDQVFVTTDGMENASCEYAYPKINQMVRRQTEKYGWEFIFLGANIDAVATAARCGIHADRAANYCADAQGTRLNYETVGQVLNEFRMNQSISDQWKNKIDEDFSRRSQ